LVGEDDLRDRIEEQIGAGPLESLFAERHVKITPAIRRAGDSEFAYNSVKEEFLKLEALRGHSMEVLEAQIEIAEAEDREDLTWRLGVSALAVDPTTQRDVDDTTETVTADNGLSLSKDERNDFLKVLESLDPAKSGRKKPRT
jgi:DNA primase